MPPPFHPLHLRELCLTHQPSTTTTNAAQAPPHRPRRLPRNRNRQQSIPQGPTLRHAAHIPQRARRHPALGLHTRGPALWPCHGPIFHHHQQQHRQQNDHRHNPSLQHLHNDRAIHVSEHGIGAAATVPAARRRYRVLAAEDRGSRVHRGGLRDRSC